MKKFRFMLPALVFALTFAVSFASASDLFAVKYAYQDTNADVCRELASNPCDNENNFACTVISAAHGGPYQAYSSNVAQGSPAVCTTVLRNSDPNPILVP